MDKGCSVLKLFGLRMTILLRFKGHLLVILSRIFMFCFKYCFSSNVGVLFISMDFTAKLKVKT